MFGARTPRSTWMLPALALAVLAVVLSGCSLGPSSSTSPSKPSNGTILAQRKITTYGLPSATLYQIFYECRGQRVEVYLTVPTDRGPFPLLVSLHGGAAWDTVLTHENFGYTASIAARLASSHFARLYPEYQGYMESSGDVMGLYTDTLDTIAGIRAAQSIARINRHRLYLPGASIGGGVALKVASMLPGVKAVVAVSPYVGLRTVLPWQQAHAQPGTFFDSQLGNEVSTYGAHPSFQILSKESPDITAINAPVLLLQGTGDHHVAWQTVQPFSQEMKAAGKTVKLILYPGGHHGLHNANGAASLAAIHSWLQQYGLSFSP
ncbi:MAG: alpha/beta hydrolase family protein [Clostridia bacterium]